MKIKNFVKLAGVELPKVVLYKTGSNIPMMWMNVWFDVEVLEKNIVFWHKSVMGRPEPVKVARIAQNEITKIIVEF